MWVTGIDASIHGISRQKYSFQFILMCFFCNFCMGKNLQLFVFHFVFLRMASHSTRSKKASTVKLLAVLPLKKTPKTKKKSVVVDEDVEETQAVSPELSQSDLARLKLAGLLAAFEVSETKRLKDLAILKAVAKDLEDCVNLHG